mmetsp:Transcript_98551/g.287508  ORF Transcript_98551/g.287508 Transcript_98551/m.287508 type:complete len:509 (+) Transcript_98551:396-1922(+)
MLPYLAHPLPSDVRRRPAVLEHRVENLHDPVKPVMADHLFPLLLVWLDHEAEPPSLFNLHGQNPPPPCRHKDDRAEYGKQQLGDVGHGRHQREGHRGMVEALFPAKANEDANGKNDLLDCCIHAVAGPVLIVEVVEEPDDHEAEAEEDYGEDDAQHHLVVRELAAGEQPPGAEEGGPGKAHAQHRDRHLESPLVGLGLLLLVLHVQQEPEDRGGEGQGQEQQRQHLPAAVLRERVPGLLALRVRQPPADEVAGGLHRLPGEGEARDVVLRVHRHLVPELLVLVLLAVVAEGDPLADRPHCPLEQQLARDGDRNRQEHSYRGPAEEGRLLHAAPEVDGCEGGHMREEHGVALDVRLGVRYGPRLPAEDLADRSGRQGQDELQDKVPEDQDNGIHQELELDGHALEQIRLHKVVEAGKEEHGAEDGDGGGDDHVGVAPHVRIRVVGEVEEAHDEADGSEQRCRNCNCLRRWLLLLLGERGGRQHAEGRKAQQHGVMALAGRSSFGRVPAA